MGLDVRRDRWSGLRRRIDGDVVTPDVPEYDQVRRVWNLMIDRRPAAIARCASAADVAEAVQFAREHDLAVSIRSGGHNIAGSSVCDGGLMLDLSRMKGVLIDPSARTAHAQAGVTWGEFDRRTQAFGLATTGGMISTTGIAGLTLGGGLGWLMRRYGLTCDNLRSARMITADAREIVVSADSHPDLFFAIRGGGGRFGIVTTFEYGLHEVNDVVAGIVFHRGERAEEVLRFFRDACADAPDELTMLGVLTIGPPAPFLPRALHGQPLVGIAMCCVGDLDEAERIVAPIRSFGPPAVDLISRMPYCAFQTMQDPSAPPGLLNYSKSLFLRDLSDGVIRTLAARALSLPSPLSQVHIHHLGGMVAKVAPEETAFQSREASFLLNIPAAWTAPEHTDVSVGWVRSLFEAVRSNGMRRGYVNFDAEPPPDAGASEDLSAVGQRLSEVKRRYDPTDFFHVVRSPPTAAR